VRAERPATDDELQALATQYLDGVQHTDERDIATQIERWKTDHGVDDGHGGRYLRTFIKKGCQVCEGRGLKGRLGIYELMLNDEEIRHHIRHRSSAGDIRASALRAGMKTLRQDGIDKVVQGLTDISEVIAATNL